MSQSAHFISLYVELFLNVIGLVLGIVLLFRARDNRLMFLWGVFTVVVMGLTAHINIETMIEGSSAVMTRHSTLLRVGLLIKTLFGAILATLFPIISLRPNLMTLPRMTLMMTPFLLVLIVVRCFYWFDGSPTPLHSAADIATQISHPDVQMRIMILLLTVVLSVFNIVYPFVNKWVSLRRRISKGMYIYSVAILIILILYVLYTSTADMTIFYLYTYMLILVPIAISIIYLVNENPLSLPLSDKQVEVHTVGNVKEREIVNVEAQILYEKMEHKVVSETLYVDPSYSIEQLAQSMEVSQNMIIRAIRERGFSGFLEYLTFLRIEHFKALAVKLPGLSIKELMYGSGFTSRSSFYRRFAQQESMSPKEYIEKRL